jgi:adenosylmethionine-8-amino-7-oxononanoate aminotransferase
MDRLGPDALIEYDRKHVWHPYASLTDAPPAYPVESASGARLRLADGRELIDGMSSWWSAIHGYNHPVLNAAAKDQLDRMAHVMFGGITHGPAVELCRLLVDITPEGIEKVFLCDSGSVAVEVGIKMALQYQVSLGRPEKHRLLTIRSGYHGDTFGAMAVCDPETGMHHLFTELLPKHLFAPAPECRFEDAFEEVHIAEFKRLIETHRDELAAVILEPIVQGAGGMRFYAPGYLRRVRELCDEHDVLLILDEIATGFGRSGTLFGADHAGVTPDIMCIGKAMTGGYLTQAATLCSDRVSDGICSGEAPAVMHGPTFMGNPLASAISRASIELLLSQPWQETVRGIEKRLAQGLAPARELPSVADVRVLGAIGVIEMREPVEMASVQARFVEEGIWIRPFGRLVYTMPPYVIEDDDLETLIRSLVRVVETI